MDEFIYLCSLRNEETAACYEKIFRQESIAAKVYAMSGEDAGSEEENPDSSAAAGEIYMLYVLSTQLEQARLTLSAQPAADRFEDPQMKGTIAPDAEYLDILTRVGSGTQPYSSVYLAPVSAEPAPSGPQAATGFLKSSVQILAIIGAVFSAIMAFRGDSVSTTLLWVLATLILTAAFFRLKRKNKA